MAAWARWHKLVSSLHGPRSTDQPAFRAAMWECNPSFLTLCPEYNLRANMSYFIGGNATVKIIHDRSPRCDELKEIIKNRPLHQDPRVF